MRQPDPHASRHVVVAKAGESTLLQSNVSRVSPAQPGCRNRLQVQGREHSSRQLPFPPTGFHLGQQPRISLDAMPLGALLLVQQRHHFPNAVYVHGTRHCSFNHSGGVQATFSHFPTSPWSPQCANIAQNDVQLVRLLSVRSQNYMSLAIHG